MVPAITRANRGKAILIGYLGFSAVYLFAGTVHFRPASALVPSPVDTLIPMVDWTIWIYLSQFVFLFLALWLFDDSRARTHLFYAMLLATVIAAPIFLILPTEIVREPPSQDGMTGLLWQGLYLTDPRTNCFPSLHVALAALAAARFVKAGGYWCWLGLSWAMLLAISTLTTKQHVVIDVLGGAALAAASHLLAKRLTAGAAK